MSKWELYSNVARVRPLDEVIIKRFKQNAEPSHENLEEIVNSIDFVVPPAYEVYKPGYEWGPREFILVTEAVSREYLDDIIEQFQPDSYCSFINWWHVGFFYGRDYDLIGDSGTKTLIGHRDVWNTMQVMTKYVSHLGWLDLFNAMWVVAEHDVDSVLCDQFIYEMKAPLSHSLHHDSPENEDFRHLDLGYYLPNGISQIAWQYRLVKPWDWCLQTVLRESEMPPEPVDVESAAAWLRHRFLYQGKFDHSEEATIIFKESKRRESVNGEWPRLPLTMFNALLYDLVKKAHIDPINNPSEFFPSDRVLVVLPNTYYIQKFKENYGYAGSDDYEFVNQSYWRFLPYIPPRSKIAAFLIGCGLGFQYSYWDPVKKAKRTGRKWAFRRAACATAATTWCAGFFWCNFKLNERFAHSNAGAVYRKMNSFYFANKEVKKKRNRIDVLGGWGPGQRAKWNKDRALELEAFQKQRKEGNIIPSPS